MHWFGLFLIYFLLHQHRNDIEVDVSSLMNIQSQSNHPGSFISWSICLSILSIEVTSLRPGVTRQIFFYIKFVELSKDWFTFFNMLLKEFASIVYWTDEFRSHSNLILFNPRDWLIPWNTDWLLLTLAIELEISQEIEE